MMREGIINLILVAAFMVSSVSFGTIQVPERLVIGFDTVDIDTKPLTALLEDDKDLIIREKEGRFSISSNCWRGYRGTWQLINDSLFLKQLYSSCDRNAEQISLEKLFQGQVKEHGVWAYWVNDTLALHQWFIQENELKIACGFRVENGRLIKVVNQLNASWLDDHSEFDKGFFTSGLFKTKNDETNYSKIWIGVVIIGLIIMRLVNLKIIFKKNEA